MKNSHSSTSGPFGDGFNPLVASGEIIQMILENAPAETPHGLQAAYEGDPTIVTSVADIFGPPTFIGGLNKEGLKVTPISETAGIPLSVSGFIQRPTNAASALEVGDLFMFRTLFGSDSRPQRGAITTDAEAAALSLGPGTLAVNTGSGIVPVALASGVSQFINIATIVIPDDLVGTDVIWHQAGTQFPDRFYSVVTGDDFVTMLVPGFYKATYVVSCFKTNGNQRSTVESTLLLNDDTVIGSRSFAVLRNTVDSENTANGAALFNAEANDQIKLHVEKQTNVFEGVSIRTRESVLIIEYLGPPRGGVSAT
jgi:hypothetical protein